MNYKYQYLLNLQYLGFRLHGWQKQPKLKTVHLFVDKTLKFIYGDIHFKTIGIGRTDAKVSALDYYVQLLIDEPVKEDFVNLFNRNSPYDVKLLSISPISDEKFNIIQYPKIKEYRYYFSYGEKNHPYSAAFMVNIFQDLDIEIMQKGAKLFEGFHNFINYCTKPTEHTKVERSILSCEIVENTEFTASFFPEKSYMLSVRSEGFLRNQIRLIMGMLFELGKGNYTLKDIEKTLKEKVDHIKVIAPASGLHLHKIDFIE